MGASQRGGNLVCLQIARVKVRVTRPYYNLIKMLYATYLPFTFCDPRLVRSTPAKSHDEGPPRKEKEKLIKGKERTRKKGKILLIFCKTLDSPASPVERPTLDKSERPKACRSTFSASCAGLPRNVGPSGLV